MDDLKTLTGVVKSILIADEQTRNSDSFLYFRVLEYYGAQNGVDLNGMSVVRFLLHMKEYGFLAFESVRRTRQKLQASFPELASCDRVAEMRGVNEERFREYAKDVLI